MSHRQYLHIFHIVEFSFFHVFRRHNILIIFIFLRYGYIFTCVKFTQLVETSFRRERRDRQVVSGFNPII